MKQFILDFPKQFQKGIEAVEKSDIKRKQKKISQLIVCGMGGSAHPAEFFKMLPHFNLPVIVHRSYGLPKMADEKSLFFISSYSGNTEEALDAFSEAKKRGFTMIGFAVGGKLEELCVKNNVPFVKYPKEAKGFQPRFAFGYSFGAMFYTLAKLGLTPISSDEVKKKLTELALSLNEKIARLEKIGKPLSKKIYKNIPIVYAPYNLAYLAYIWKIGFNETSKSPCFWHYFPELDHNELNGWVNAGKIVKNKFIIIILKGGEDNERVLKQIDATTALVKKKGIKVVKIDFEKGLVLEKIFSSVVLSMWTSYYLALLYKVEPEPTKMVEEFKKLMKE